MKSIFDLRKERYRKWFGASKKSYRKCDLEKILEVHNDFSYILELHTRYRIVPCNEEFKNKKAIPHYNEHLKRMQEKYPDYKEFQLMKFINHPQQG